MESYLARARRVIGSGVEGVVGAVERLSGDGLLRQAIRDVDGVVDQQRRQGEAARQREQRERARARTATERAEALTEQARFALAMGRDDLAQVAVAEQLAAEQQARQAELAARDAAAAGARLAAGLAELQAKKARLEEQYRIEQNLAGSAPTSSSFDARVVRAEEAFDRALVAKGAAPGDPARHGQVAEIDALRRDRAVADRLTALRDGLEQPASRPPRGKR